MQALFASPPLLFLSGLDFYGYVKLINFVRLKVGVPLITSTLYVWRMGNQDAVLSICLFLITV